MILLAWSALWVPFFVAAGIFFFLLNRPKIAGGVATAGMVFSFIASLLLLIRLGIPQEPIESSFRWVALADLTVEFGILVNGLTLLMLLVVTGVGSLIFLYSQEYMENDKGYSRYFAELSLFAFSMLGIVLSNNLIQIFIFWELVGLSSYLLIGHWFEKPEASDAGKKAFLTTRVGDVGFLLGILLLFGWLQAGGEATFNFLRIEDLLEGIRRAGVGAGLVPAHGGETQGLPLLTVAGLLIFLGVVGKSAQFPLHVWLPDAMEGPTPVSALIHGCTMVAAGVFLLARLFFFFSISPLVLFIIAATGTLTAFFATTLALVENDIKRILAFSTLSQLGYMVACLGLGNPQAGMFHLTTHAFFKALLFLGAGSVIHVLHTQNIWKMSGFTPSPPPPSAPPPGTATLPSPSRGGEGRAAWISGGWPLNRAAPSQSLGVRGAGLLTTMPVTGWTFLAGTLALVGIFPAAGFWSKEEILMSAYLTNFPMFFFLLMAAFFTAVYMGRLFAVVFLRGGGKGGHAHDPGWSMKIPLVILALLSLGGGFLPFKNFVPLEHAHPGPFLVTILGLVAGTVGFLSALYVYGARPEMAGLISQIFSGPKKLFEKKYYVDEIYKALVRYGQDALARACDLFERHIVVSFAVNGTARLTRFAGHVLRQIQTGQVQFYGLVFSVGVTLVIYGFLLWKQ